MTIRPIGNDHDLAAALRRVDELWEAQPGTPEADELDVLAALIEAYESESLEEYPTDPLELISLRLKQLGWSQNQLGRAIGVTSGRVFELLNGERPLTLQLVDQLARALELPAGYLVPDSGLAP